MHSPFPGMDPYLENPELWPEVHSRLIVGIADALNETLSQKYRIAIERRVYQDDHLLVGIPDVSIVAKPDLRDPALSTRVATQPITVLLPEIEEVQERYLEIREIKTGAVITVIEVLSPKNKRSGEGRTIYERKRNRILASLTHLVEIDLLRGDQPLPMIGSNLSAYRILVSRHPTRPTAQLYEFTVRESIPEVPIPLLAGEEEPVMSLQFILQDLYEKGRYHLALDYTGSPQPPLTQADAEWADHLLRAAGLR